MPQNVKMLDKSLPEKLLAQQMYNSCTKSFKSKLATLNSSKPTYIDVKGRSGVGQYMYLLGGMSFDMFRPAGLVCSLQGTFNTIHAIDPKSEELPVFIPRSLRKEVRLSLSHHEADSLRT
jgi:hypothetical protein